MARPQTFSKKENEKKKTSPEIRKTKPERRKKTIRITG